MLEEKNYFSNDNTLKGIGLDYQKLFAIEMCFNTKKNDTIWIECRGDVANEDNSVEIKHHSSESNVTSNSVDVWKTIKNYTEEIYRISSFNNLYFYTTQDIKENCIFDNWNNKTGDKKFSILQSHSPSTTIKNDYYDKIINFSDRELLIKALNKMKIFGNKPKISDKWEELKSHPIMTIIPYDYRDQALQQLVGYITQKAFSENKWIILKNDFDRDFQFDMRRFVQEKISFPYVAEDEVQHEDSHINFHFVEEIENISLKKPIIQMAISDYLRANLSQFKLLEDYPTIDKILNQYDNELQRELNLKKYNVINEISRGILIDEYDNASQSLFFKCLDIPTREIKGVENTEKYYKDGRIHFSVENQKFSWIYESEELE